MFMGGRGNGFGKRVAAGTDLVTELFRAKDETEGLGVGADAWLPNRQCGRR